MTNAPDGPLDAVGSVLDAIDIVDAVTSLDASGVPVGSLVKAAARISEVGTDAPMMEKPTRIAYEDRAMRLGVESQSQRVAEKAMSIIEGRVERL